MRRILFVSCPICNRRASLREARCPHCHNCATFRRAAGAHLFDLLSVAVPLLALLLLLLKHRIAA